MSSVKTPGMKFISKVSDAKLGKKFIMNGSIPSQNSNYFPCPFQIKDFEKIEQLPLQPQQIELLKQRISEERVKSAQREQKTKKFLPLCTRYSIQSEKLILDYSFEHDVIRSQILPQISTFLNNQTNTNMNTNNARSFDIEFECLVLQSPDLYVPFHRDTEKRDNVFATLFVFLPSKYLGGKLIIEHLDQRKNIDISEENSKEIVWFVFWPNAIHSFPSLMSGYRLALVFDIVCTSIPLPPSLSHSPSLSPSHSHSQSQSSQQQLITSSNATLMEVKSAFIPWQSEPSIVVVPLEHFYRTSAFKYELLKTCDFELVSDLRAIRKHFQFEMYMVLIDKQNTIFHWVDLDDKIMDFGTYSFSKIWLSSQLNSPFDKVEYFHDDFDMEKPKKEEKPIWNIAAVVCWPSNFSREVFGDMNEKIMTLWSDSLSIARKQKPEFDKTEREWQNVFYWFDRLGKLKPNDSIKVLEFLIEIDCLNSNENELKLTKDFLKTSSTIRNTNKQFLAFLKQTILKYGGFSSWWESISQLAKNLREFGEIFAWLIDSANDYREGFVKTPEEREKIFNLKFNPSTHSHISLALGKLGDRSEAHATILLMLNSSNEQIFHPRWRFNENSPTPIVPSHFLQIIQAFSFDEKMCFAVVKHIKHHVASRSTATKVVYPISNVIFFVWSMFFEQSSLQRLRLESVKRILRLGRLIGSSKSLSNSRRANLKLILNVKNEIEIASSRLSTLEFEGVASNSMNRKTLEKFSSLGPKFVRDCFPQGYTSPPPFPLAEELTLNEKNANHNINTMFWNVNPTSFNNPFAFQLAKEIFNPPKAILHSNLENEGPCGLHSQKKLKFFNELANLFFEDETLKSEELVYVESALNSRNYPKVMLISFAATLKNWEQFERFVSFITPNEESSLWHQTNFSKSLTFAFAIAIRNFKQKNQTFTLDRILRKYRCGMDALVHAGIFRPKHEKLDEDYLNLARGLFESDVYFHIQMEQRENLFDDIFHSWCHISKILDTEPTPPFPKSGVADFEWFFELLESRKQQGISNRKVQILIMQLILGFDSEKTQQQTSTTNNSTNTQLLNSLLNLRQFHLFIQKAFGDVPQNKILADRLFDLISKQVYFKCVPSQFAPTSLKPILKPENANELFAAFLELVCEFETISTPKKTLNYVLSAWASPEIFENLIQKNLVAKNELKTQILMDLLNLCIPPHNLSAPTPDQQAFEKFLASENEKEIFYSAETKSKELNYVEYIRYFDWKKGDPDERNYHKIEYRKKFLPFRALRTKLQETNKREK